MSNTRTLPQIAKAIKALEKKSIQNVVEIGKLLHEASEQCEHGEYMRWLKTEFGWSHNTSLRYRSVYDLSQNRQIGDFANLDNLDISISALYAAAAFLKHGVPAIKQGMGFAILKAARQGRVSHHMVDDIILKYQETIKPAASPVKTDPAIETDKDDESPNDEHDDESSVETSLDETEPPADDDADDADDADDDDSDNPYDEEIEKLNADEEFEVVVLQDLDDALHQPDIDWAKIIQAVGSEKFREIIYELKSKLDQYNQDKEVKAKADAAEARRNAVANEKVEA